MRSGVPKLPRPLMVAFSLFLLLSLLPVATALAEPTFATDNFKAKWQRADKPVADGNANPQRSWLWGPESFNPPTYVKSDRFHLV